MGNGNYRLILASNLASISSNESNISIENINIPATVAERDVNDALDSMRN